MNLKKLLAVGLGACALLLGNVQAADDKAASADTTQTDKAEKPKKKRVKPHSHPRDAKGVPVSDKKDAAKADAPASDQDGKPQMKPHNHQRDAK